MKTTKTRTGLDPFVPSTDNPWDEKRALHLLRRSGFDPTPVKARNILSLSPTEAVDQMVDQALELTTPDRDDIWNTLPPSSSAPQEDKDAFRTLNDEASENYKNKLVRRMLNHGLREKMAFLWSNHFVTQKGVVFYTAFMDDYYNLLRTHALGNYKQFVHDIGLSPAMLRYLNGNQNLKDHPNENFGRELLELFTMGVGNYTQNDVLEVSRALTGWRDLPESYETEFREFHHDAGEKTIFGQTGNWNYDDLIDIIFAERGMETARFTVDKIYKMFVYAVPDPNIIEELATIMVDNDFAIEPVIRTLLKSEHFFDSAFIGSRIKEPLELATNLIPVMGAGIESDELINLVRSNSTQWGQNVMDPPNVKGWTGNRNWISSGSLLTRWQFTVNMITRFGIDKTELLSWSTDPNDPRVVAADLAKSILARDIDEADLVEYGDIFLASSPDYEWNPADDQATQLLERYVKFLIQLPAFQLS